jgi:hypothetical protein
MFCQVCKEAFETIEVLNDEMLMLKEMLESSRSRENELHERLDRMVDKEKIFLENEKKFMERERVRLNF